MGSCSESTCDPRVEAAIRRSFRSGGGVPADRPDLHGDLPGLPAALGRALASVHAAPVPESVPVFDPVSAVRARLDAGRIDPSRLPEPYSSHPAADLVDRLEQAPTAPAAGPPVCCVGRLTIGRLLLVDGELAGIGGGSFGLVADRHADLAVVQQSIFLTLGGDAVFGFYEAYRSDPNIVELDRWTLAAHLLGWLP